MKYWKNQYFECKKGELKDLEDKRLLKITEICEMYSLSRKVVDKAINNGQLKCYQINAKERRCKEKDVDKWLETLVITPSIDCKMDFNLESLLGVKNVRV